MWKCCAVRRQPQPPSLDTAKTPFINKQETRAPASSRQDEKTQKGSFCERVLTPALREGMSKHKPVHIPQAAAMLTDVFAIDRVMTAFGRGSDAGCAQAYKRGEPCMRETFALSYLDQASIRLSDAERFFQPLFDICQELAKSLEFVTATLVLEPPGTRAPAVVLPEDVIAIQLWGEQKIRLGRPTAGLPMTAPRPEPLLCPTLEAGDAVYIPQGVECRMDSGGSSGVGLPQPVDPLTGRATSSRGPGQSKEPVMYLLLTVGTNDQSFEASLGMYITDMLREKGKFSTESDAFFRSAVTKNIAPDRYLKSRDEAALAQKAQLQERMQTCTAELLSNINAKSLREHFSARMGKLKDAQRQGAEKMLASMAGPLPRGIVTSKARVRVSPDVTCRCQAGSSVAHFKRGGETLSLPIAATASYLISRLADGAPHVIYSLPCDDPVERLCVVQILVPKGCLQIMEEGIPEE